MEAWKKLGSFIGDHMAIISPLCVLFAVLFPDQISVLKPLVTPLFAFMTFQGSLSNTFSNLAHTMRHPAPMLVSLAMASVVMPVTSYLLASLFFSSSPDIVCGIVLEYSVPVAVVSCMWIGMHDGDTSLGLATLLVSTVLSPFTIPLTLEVLVGQTVEVDVVGMMEDMLIEIAIPALLGIATNDLTHGWGKRVLSPAISPAARISLVLVILCNSTSIAPYVRNLTPTLVGVIVFIGLFAASGYALGLIVARLWHQPRETQVTMTYSIGMRNISAGAVIAAEFFPGEAMFPVVMGTLFQQVLAALAGKVLDRVAPVEALVEVPAEPTSEALSTEGAPSSPPKNHKC